MCEVSHCPVYRRLHKDATAFTETSWPSDERMVHFINYFRCMSLSSYLILGSLLFLLVSYPIHAGIYSAITSQMGRMPLAGVNRNDHSQQPSPQTADMVEWSTIIESSNYNEKLLLLCHNEIELRKAGYVLDQLSNAQLDKKLRCQECNGQTTLTAPRSC